MSAGPPKRRKTDAEALIELHRGPYVSERSLTYILKYVRDNGIPGNISRYAQYSARQKLIGAESNQYGDVLVGIDMPLNSGKSFKNWACAPGPYLYSTAKRSKGFRDLLRRQLAKHPCSLASPWRICLYFDGISPRDPLAKGKDHRGVDAVYWSFLEFDEFLQDEDAWLVLSTARVSKVRDMPGGIGQSVAMTCNELMFNTSGGVNFRTTGVILDVSEAGDATRHATIIARLGCTVGDEEALREFHMNKGHAGTKPCAICRNVLNQKFDYASHDTSGTFISDACLDRSKRVVNADAQIVAILERLRPDWERYDRGEISDNKWKEITQLKGWNFHPTHVALDANLAYGVMSLLCFDWMHIYSVNGIVAKEVKAFTENKAVCKLCSAEDLNDYLSNWTWPHKFHAANAVFAQGELQANASQELSMIPVLAHFIRQVIAKLPDAGTISGHIASLLALCDAIDMVILSSRGLATARELDVAVMKHLELHTRTYGTKYWVYKHHMATHLADMYFKFGPLNCFVHERKHKVCKKFAKDHLCMRTPEKSLMMQLTAQHSYDMEHFSISTTLVDPVAATKKLMGVLKELRPQTQSASSSLTAWTKYGPIHRGDICLLGRAAGHAAVQVWFHVDCDTETAPSGPLCLVLELQTRHVHSADYYSRYSIDEDNNPVLIPLDSLRHPVINRRLGDAITCIWPVEYRKLEC